MPIARSLARRVARLEADEEALIQVALFSYHKATTKPYTDAAPMDRPYAFARTVLYRAMRRYYARPTAMDDASSIEEDDVLDLSAARQADLLDFDDYFDALERAHGAVARQVAENLLAPSGACAGNILNSASNRAAKRAALPKREQIHAPRGCTRRVRLSADGVRQGLGLSAVTWNRTLADVREFTRAWLKRMH